jgi:two-component system chemotaxis response regulator CheY
MAQERKFMNILTVDDSKAVRMTIALTLKQAGHHVVEAECGEDALKLLKTEKIDLIISDFNMPGMDGSQLTRQIKDNPDYHAIPIIILTTENAKGRLSEAKTAGAVGWMNKPFKAEQLVAAIQILGEKFGIT